MPGSSDHTQQPLLAIGIALGLERAANVERWRARWNAVPNFQPKGRQAALDREAGPEVLALR